MIGAIPSQRASRIPSVQSYGCYFCSLVAVAQDARRRSMTIDDRDELFRSLVAHRRIDDNDIPIGDDGWRRAYILDPVAVVRAAGDALGMVISATELARVEAPTTFAGPAGTTHSIIEWRTAHGSHFVVAKAGTIDVVYNPWPELPLSGQVRSTRHWRVV